MESSGCDSAPLEISKAQSCAIRVHVYDWGMSEIFIRATLPLRHMSYLLAAAAPTQYAGPWTNPGDQ